MSIFLYRAHIYDESHTVKVFESSDSELTKQKLTDLLQLKAKPFSFHGNIISLHQIPEEEAGFKALIVKL